MIMSGVKIIDDDMFLINMTVITMRNSGAGRALLLRMRGVIETMAA